MKERITGRSMKPFAMPNIMMPNHSLKITRKIYVFAGARARIDKNVDKPPWNTLEPILLRAC
jgi:hypothetical protein